MRQPLNEALSRHFIGFEPLLRFTELAGEASFPPHNIERFDENRYRLTLAVAGFSKADLTLTLQDGVLKIDGRYGSGGQVEEESEVIYRGIAFRNFTRLFKIGENVEVRSADLTDGLLVIDLERIVPEEQKPKLIRIR